MLGTHAAGRRNSELLIALIGSFSFLYLLTGTSSLTRLVHLPYQARYFQPVIPFAALGLAMAFAFVGRRTPRTALWSGSAVAFVIIVPSIAAALLLSGSMYRAPYYRMWPVSCRF